jgi:hypothetical protein
MTKREPGVTIDQKGTGFILRRTIESGRTTQITLSAQDVLQLVQSAHNFRQTAMSLLLPAAVGAVYATPLDRVAVTPDALGENILLSLADRSGGSTIFEASLDIAADLAEKNPVKSRGYTSFSIEPTLAAAFLIAGNSDTIVTCPASPSHHPTIPSSQSASSKPRVRSVQTRIRQSLSACSRGL